MKASMRGQKGGASLLTTVILSILLLGVVGGLATLSINEIRQAANTEQSARALAAAESGVQRLAEKIEAETGPHERTACNSEPSTPNIVGPTVELGGNSEITCAIVKAGDSEETEGVVDRDQSYRIDLSGAYKKESDGSKTPKSVTHMSIEWHGAADDAMVLPSVFTYPGLASNYWGSPAALELTYVYWGASGSITPLSTGQLEDYGLGFKKVAFVPSSNLPGVPPNKCGVVDGPRIKVITDSYSCTTFSGADVTDPLNRRFNLSSTLGVPAERMVFKLTARYNATHFRLRFYNKEDVLTVPQAYATIDVTARSNDLYRRVIAQKPLTLTGSIDYLDNTIFSGKNICKDMKVDVGYGPATYQSGVVVDSVDGGKNSQSCENPPQPTP